MSKNGLANPTMIDLVNLDASGKSVTLVIVQDQEWPRGEELLKALVAKVNTYMSFARLGTMVQHYPEAAGRQVRLQLMSHVEVPAEVQEAVRNMGAAMQKWDATVELVDVSTR
jgi:hypothetical protein